MGSSPFFKPKTNKMKIQRVNIKNFKGIRSYEGEIGGKHVYLVGGNEQGKTSFIDAIWLGISGKNCPPEPITDGGAKGLIEVEFEDFIARTKFKKGRSLSFELENKVFTKESEKFIKAPRSYMEQRVGILDFDINNFFNKTDAEQVKYFSKIMGVDFSDLDSELEEVAESRKFDKKKLAEIKTKTNYFNEEDAAKDLVDVVGLSKRIETENEKARTYERINNGVNQRRVDILDREAKIKELTTELEGMKLEVEGGEKWLEDDNNMIVVAALAEMRQELENSTETNAKITEAKTAQKAEAEADKYAKLIEVADQDITNLKDEKAQRISDQINVEGLEYSTKEERFLWNGLPFDPKQINTASQLIAGMKIGSTMLKDLKILKVDASLIDKVNFDKVLEWAFEENIELFVELVDREAAKLEVVIQDPAEHG